MSDMLHLYHVAAVDTEDMADWAAEGILVGNVLHQKDQVVEGKDHVHHDNLLCMNEVNLSYKLCSYTSSP